MERSQGFPVNAVAFRGFNYEFCFLGGLFRAAARETVGLRNIHRFNLSCW